jgi:polyphosphate glucokinase
MPDRKGTYEDYVGRRGLKRLGKKKWARHVAVVVGRMAAAIYPDDIVLGGGNTKKLKALPPGCRAGQNVNAFAGGFRLWDAAAEPTTDGAVPKPKKARKSEAP